MTVEDLLKLLGPLPKTAEVQIQTVQAEEAHAIKSAQVEQTQVTRYPGSAFTQLTYITLKSW